MDIYSISLLYNVGVDATVYAETTISIYEK